MGPIKESREQGGADASRGAPAAALGLVVLIVTGASVRMYMEVAHLSKGPRVWDLPLFGFSRMKHSVGTKTALHFPAVTPKSCRGTGAVTKPCTGTLVHSAEDSAGSPPPRLAKNSPAARADWGRQAEVAALGSHMTEVRAAP